MQLDAQVSVAGGALVQEEQWVLLAHGIGIFDFMKERLGVVELRLKLLTKLLADHVATFADPRSDRCVDVLGARTKLAAHRSDTFFRDALRGPTPSGMKCPNDFVFPVHQENRETVCGEYAESDTSEIGDQAVADQRLFRSVAQHMDNIGVDLAIGNQRP